MTEMATSNMNAASHATSSRATKPKRYLCVQCQRRFARSEHLQRHERTHTNEKPFTCDVCNAKFSRSDLLTRHGRLAHKRYRPASLVQGSTSTQQLSTRPRQADPTTHGVGLSDDIEYNSWSADTPCSSGNTLTTPFQSTEQHTVAHGNPEIQDLDGSCANGHAVTGIVPDQPFAQACGANHAVDDNVSLEGFSAFLDGDLFTSNFYPSLLSAEQPMPFFSPDSANTSEGRHYTLLSTPKDPALEVSDHASFSRYGSRLPSLEPLAPDAAYQQTTVQSPSKPMGRAIQLLSEDDRETLSRALTSVSSVLPANFRLPSRLALSRHIGAYINCFHPHLPFLHFPTLSLPLSRVELVLAMAAVGTQYCFEGSAGLPLFHAARNIAIERIRQRDIMLAEWRTKSIAPVAASASEPDDANSIQTAQALLILMAMATWQHQELPREALSIQSMLASLIREDGFHDTPTSDESIWTDWAASESRMRTKFVIYCFFNLHCIVYNIPPLILNSELHMTLPCSAAEFRAEQASTWRELRSQPSRQCDFQRSLHRLFARGGHDATIDNSSLENYILVHALVQHLFMLRHRAQYVGDIQPDDVSAFERAIRNWQVGAKEINSPLSQVIADYTQLGWNRNGESSLDTLDPNGPVAFNATALLRLAYVRLCLDTGPERALETRDPVTIANALKRCPVLKRTPRSLRAVLHSAHSLSIPIKIGIQLVARTQTFIWSIQHSVCTLECALLLSKWLQAIALPNPDPPIRDEERRIGSLLRTLLDETEFALPADSPHDLVAISNWLNAGVLRVWATIFKGAQTWAIVDVVGCALDIYADILELP